MLSSMMRTLLPQSTATFSNIDWLCAIAASLLVYRCHASDGHNCIFYCQNLARIQPNSAKIQKCHVSDLVSTSAEAHHARFRDLSLSEHTAPRVGSDCYALEDTPLPPRRGVSLTWSTSKGVGSGSVQGRFRVSSGSVQGRFRVGSESAQFLDGFEAALRRSATPLGSARGEARVGTALVWPECLLLRHRYTPRTVQFAKFLAKNSAWMLLDGFVKASFQLHASSWQLKYT